VVLLEKLISTIIGRPSSTKIHNNPTEGVATISLEDSEYQTINLRDHSLLGAGNYGEGNRYTLSMPLSLCVFVLCSLSSSPSLFSLSLGSLISLSLPSLFSALCSLLSLFAPSLTALSFPRSFFSLFSQLSFSLSVLSFFSLLLYGIDLPD